MNKKEPLETFGWIPDNEVMLYEKSDTYYMEDFRAALGRVEGSREWMTSEEWSVEDEMAERVQADMSKTHSASSGTCTFYAYRRALKDWDNWVFTRKKYYALLKYKAQQPSLQYIESLIDSCNEYKAKPDEDLGHEIKYYCRLMGITGCVTELCALMEDVVDEMRGPPLEDSPPAPPIDYPFLPLGAHLLPPSFQQHLREWNIDMTNRVGDWMREERKKYKELFPERWKEFRAETRYFGELYAEEVEAVKAYQALHSSQTD